MLSPLEIASDGYLGFVKTNTLTISVEGYLKINVINVRAKDIISSSPSNRAIDDERIRKGNNEIVLLLRIFTQII